MCRMRIGDAGASRRTHRSVPRLHGVSALQAHRTRIERGGRRGRCELEDPARISACRSSEWAGDLRPIGAVRDRRGRTDPDPYEATVPRTRLSRSASISLEAISHFTNGSKPNRFGASAVTSRVAETRIVVPGSRVEANETESSERPGADEDTSDIRFRRPQPPDARLPVERPHRPPAATRRSNGRTKKGIQIRIGALSWA